MAQGAAKNSRRFSPCLNEATTLDAPFEQDCEAYSAAGFKHIELWFPKLRKQGLKPAQAADLLRQHGLTPVSACASEGCLWQKQGSLDAHLPELERNFEMAQALSVPRYVVFSFVAGRVTQDDYKIAVERFVKSRNSPRVITCESLLSSLPGLRSSDHSSHRSKCFERQGSPMPVFVSMPFIFSPASANLKTFGICAPGKLSTCTFTMCRARSPGRFWLIPTVFRPGRE